MVGYISTVFGWFDQSAVRGLTRYVFDFAVPMLLLRTLATTNLPDVIPWEATSIDTKLKEKKNKEIE